MPLPASKGEGEKAERKRFVRCRKQNNGTARNCSERTQKLKRHLFGSILLVALVLCIAIPTYAYAPFTPKRGVINRVVYEDEFSMIVEHIDTSPIRTFASEKNFTLTVYNKTTSNKLGLAYTEMKSGSDSSSAYGKTGQSTGTITYTMLAGKQYGFNAKSGGTQNSPGVYSMDKYSTTSQTFALSLYVTPKGSTSSYRKPLDSYTITSYYGYRDLEPTLDLHKGLDLVSTGTNKNVKNMSAGTVTAAGETSELGKYVVIYDGTYYFRYQHLASRSVSVNNTVTAGQIIGIQGSTGSVIGGEHLHISISKNASFNTTIDPLSFMP